MVRIELYDLLSKTQEYIAKYYAAVLTDEHKRDQLKSYRVIHKSRKDK